MTNNLYSKKTSKKNYAKKTPIFRKFNANKMVAKKKRQNLVKLIKDVQLDESEMKYKSGTYSVLSLAHNNIYEAHLWSPTPGTGVTLTQIMPSQGTNDGSRIGDRIYLKGIMLRAMFQITGDRRNTSIAIYYVPHNSEQGSPSSYNDFFHNVTGSSMMDSVQKKRFPKAKLLGRYRVKPSDLHHTSIASSNPVNSASIYMKKFIPIEKKVYFKADASVQPSNLEEYGTIVIAPYQNVNTLATDVLVVNCDIHATTYYKDI